MIEAFHKLIDDLPANNIKDKFFDQILSALNYLANMNIGNPTFVSLDNRCFSFTKLQKFDQGLTSYNPNYSSKYGKHIVKERFEDPEIISKIMQDLTNNWHNTKITSLCGIGDLPLQFLFSHLYSIFTNDDIRKSFLSYIGLIEGKAQVEYGPTGTSGEEETEFFILPVEVPKLEELKEQMSAVKEKLRLRKLRIAVMSWLPQKPAISSLEELRVQRKTFLDNTFITMMRIKEEIQFEAEKFDLPRNQRIRMEVLSEIKFLKKWLEKDFIGKGIECIKSEQAIISDLLDKSAGLMEHNMDQLRGTAATIYSNVDPDQRKCITNTLSYIQTFVSQVKNRATIAESLTTGTALIITLHDFNNSLYTLCKNVWRQQVAATKAKIWAERKVQNELHTQTYAEQEKSDRLESDMKKLKTNMEHSIAVEVGQRCYEQIYEVERRIRQCEYWKDRIMLIDKRLRKELKEEARQEIAEKELQLKNYETQFSDYKATLMAQLKAEIAANNNNLAKKYPGYTQSGSPFSKRNSVSKSPGHAGEYISSEHEKSAIENEAEAYDQLAKLQDKVHKLRVFYNMRLALQKEKYKERLCLIKKQITSNSTLYNQLSLAERREVILKQELVNAQRNMAAFEKALRQMQSSLKEKNETLMRFHQIKAAKSSRMVELEAKLKKLSAVEEIDVNALQTELWKKEKEIEELRNLASNKKEHVDTMKTSYQTQMKWMQRKIKKEESEKSEAMQKVEELQLLIAQTKANEPQSAVKKEEGGSLWREKCKELVELCKALKNENEMFRLMVSTNTNLNPGNNNLANSSSNMTVNKTMYSIDEDIPVKDIVPRRNLVNPYAEETKSINYRTNGFENMMVVTGSNNNIYMTGVKPPTRPSVNTRSSSHTGISNRVLMKSTEKPPTAGGPNVPLRPQTQHHPFFNGRKKTRLNSGYSGGRKIMNMSLYPS